MSEEIGTRWPKGVSAVQAVREMLGRGLVEPAAARAYFATIEPLLYRYPALDPRSFRAAVEMMFAPLG